MEKLRYVFDIFALQALNGLVDVDFWQARFRIELVMPRHKRNLFRRTEEFHFFAVHNDNLPETKRFVEPDGGDVFTSFIAQNRAVAHHHFPTVFPFYCRLSRADESVSPSVARTM